MSRFASLHLPSYDYAAGADVVEAAKNGPTRLNWAATSLYYSIVHTARLLIFVAYGDFPTGHTQLPDCFDGRAPTATTWLSKFLGQVGVPRDRRTGAEVNARRMELFWTGAGVADAGHVLQTVGAALRSAKDLRNDNNYESLLIAHEYRHTGLTELFARLAAAMRILARKTSRTAAQCFAAYMRTRSLGEQTFIVDCCRRRVLEPIREWHSEAIHREVETMLADILCLDASDEAGARDIDLLTSRTYFNEKEGLLRDFYLKIRTLEESVR